MRLIILSNRLPVTVTESDGAIGIYPSSGGLITGIGAYLDSLEDKNYIWVGWPGDSSYSDRAAVKKELVDNHKSIPVFIEKNTMDLFYNGFCNKTLWPLFHYFPTLAGYDEQMWNTYKEVNAIFADAVLEIIQPGDVIWIHDYHLMLAPKLIKEKQPDIPVGFFLHIPFPSFEIFRLLPRKWGKEILRSLLFADLIGFHTYDYLQYFLSCVLRVLGISHNMGTLALGHKLTKADTFPMGIDFEKFYGSGNLESVKKEKAILKKELQNHKVIFSIDRQDYTKGILNRLEGYELFLKNNQGWHRKVVLIMIVVPSRIGVEDYQRTKDVINQLVGKINGDYGNIHWTPVIYQYKAISFEQLAALYNISDVGLITPLRDGMNLVAKEYVAAQREKKGALILSEMAGAAMELGEAVIINPNNREEIAEAIKTALEMPPDEQSKRINSMQERLKKYDIIKWASDFLEELGRMKEEQKKYMTRFLKGRELKILIEKYKSARRRIIFLDHDGTLVPFTRIPAEAIPDKKLTGIIKAFSKTPGVDLVIISGRSKKDLQDWYGRYDVSLVAEHGVWIKRPKEDWQKNRELKNDWKSQMLKILINYKNRLPGSFIEEKEYSVAWHFRNSDSVFSGVRIKEFMYDMVQFTARNEIEVLMGNKVVEIKCAGVNKGDAAKKILSYADYDFIMAAGDDTTDESLFQVLPKEAYSVSIGKRNSLANFYLDSNSELLEMLDKMIGRKVDFVRNIIDFFKRV